MPAPSFMMRLVMGEFGDLMLFSQRGMPEKLLSCGFTFNHPEVEGAIRDIVET
jgi:NAD dependent epimerase/dehydratase family enzyme